MSLQRLHLAVSLRNLGGLIESIDCLMQDVPVRSMPAEARASLVAVSLTAFT